MGSQPCDTSPNKTSSPSAQASSESRPVIVQYLNNGLICQRDRLQEKQNADAGSRAGVFNDARRLRRVEAGDGLDLEIFLETVFAPFAAVTGLLVAAERRGAVVGHALQVDVAGADPAADLAGGLDGIGGDVTGQTIRRIVGDPYRVFLVLGAHHHQHRPEDFLARDGHVFGDVGEDGRADIEALVDAFRQPGAAGDQSGAFLDALLDQALDLVPLAAVDDGADGGAFGAG